MHHFAKSKSSSDVAERKGLKKEKLSLDKDVECQAPMDGFMACFCFFKPFLLDTSSCQTKVHIQKSPLSAGFR
jgi:hypothetical protein